MANNKNKETRSEPQPHNFTGLRIILFEELNLLRSGDISIGRARVTSQLARRIIEASTLDLFARGLIDKGPGVKRLEDKPSGEKEV